MKYGVAFVVGAYAIVGGALYWYFFYNQSTSSDGTDPNATPSDGVDPQSGGGSAVSTTESIVDDTEASIAGWKSVNSGPNWVPALNAAESQYGLPADLLARMAFQESSFEESVIRGTKQSPAGALGILQMLPKYFSSVNVPVPFTDSDVNAQILQSAQQIGSLYSQFGDWSLALAAYNAGAGNVRKYGGIPPFKETQNYVTQISADVPALAGAA